MKKEYTIEELRIKTKEFEDYVRKVSRLNKCSVHIELGTIIKDNGICNNIEADSKLIIKDYTL